MEPISSSIIGCFSFCAARKKGRSLRGIRDRLRSTLVHHKGVLCSLRDYYFTSGMLLSSLGPREGPLEAITERISKTSFRPEYVQTGILKNKCSSFESGKWLFTCGSRITSIMDFHGESNSVKSLWVIELLHAWCVGDFSAFKIFDFCVPFRGFYR